MRKEVENLVDLSAKDVAAPEFFNLLDLEAVPVGDVVEGYLLVQWDGIEGEHQLDRVVACVQGESMQDGNHRTGHSSWQ